MPNSRTLLQPADVAKSYKLGANSYLVKPPTSMQLVDLAKAFKWYWLEYNRFILPPGERPELAPC
jgi:hypothetical protein